MLHLELLFVQSVKLKSKRLFCCVSVVVVVCPWKSNYTNNIYWKALIFTELSFHLSQKSTSYICWCPSKFSVTLHLSMCLLFCHYHTVHKRGSKRGSLLVVKGYQSIFSSQVLITIFRKLFSLSFLSPELRHLQFFSQKSKESNLVNHLKKADSKNRVKFRQCKVQNWRYYLRI